MADWLDFFYAWVREEIFFASNLENNKMEFGDQWSHYFLIEDESDDQMLNSNPTKKCKIFEEFFRGFFIKDDAYSGYNFLLENDADFIADDAEWGNYHDLMLRDEGAEEGLINLRNNEHIIGHRQVKILESYFTSGYRETLTDVDSAKILKERASTDREVVVNEIVTTHPLVDIPDGKVIHRTTRKTSFWHSCNNFRVIFQIGEEIDEITGTLSDLDFCLWRRQGSPGCPYCTDYYDTDFEPYLNFNEWFIGEISLRYEL